MYTIDFRRPIHVHFIGIGGISMSGLSEILLKEGFTISGSDMKDSEITAHLEGLGAQIFIGQKASNIIPGIDLVVYTAAIHEDNEEYAAAVAAGLPMMSRAVLLGQIMANYEESIAVAGTHGKTTTTSMVSHILLEALADPTISVGGILDAIGGNIRVGNSNVFITEACEYTNSFFEFFPKYNIILNVEEDHMDFFKDLADIQNSFRTFAHQTGEEGVLILNSEIDCIPYLVEGLKAPYVTYGLSGTENYYAANVSFDEMGRGHYELMIDGVSHGQVDLSVNGIHNISNSLSAVAVCVAMGLPMDAIKKGLLAFGGTKRRFEYKGVVNEFTIIDDYAHHPTEIKATLVSAKNYPHKELWVVFQPHTYTRTKAFLDDFIHALSGYDHVIITNIYAAREKDPGDVHASAIAEGLVKKGCDAIYLSTFAEVEEFVINHCKKDDLLITMGAGDVVNIGENLLSR